MGKVLTPPPGMDFHGALVPVFTLNHSEANVPGASLEIHGKLALGFPLEISRYSCPTVCQAVLRFGYFGIRHHVS